VGTNPNNNNNNTSPYVKRHTWLLLEKWLEHDGSKWTLKVHVPHGGSINNNQPKKLLRIVTWNVLFDLQRDSNGSFEQGDNLIFDDKKLDTTTTRQNAIVDMLKAQNYAEGLDIICLQECTHSFITILQKQKWVQKEFAIRTSAILAPYGNMIIWNKHVFSVEEKYICQDAVRNRVLICSLKTRDGTIVNVANVHLPADKNDKDANAIEKTQARQQELSSIIGKLQILEGLARTAPIPIIAGDFNGVSHGALISKALPETVWVDSWKTVSSDPGLAVDWSCNKRANISAEAGKSQKMLRKIDSVWYGKIKGVNAIATELIDDVSNDSGLHPSDHFGVAVTFALASCSSHTTRVLSDVNAWGKAVLPSSRSLLALILDKGYIQTKLFDKKSTLPMPHITVLNNFVDLTSMDAVKLAHQTIQTAIMESLNPNINQKFSIDLASFDVFEHNLSATAVCKPTDEWLFDLYKALMHHFPSSHEQESRLATEWTPHMSLGTFENAGNARLFLETLEVESPRQVHAIGIGMFQRSNDDGNLHVIAVIPLQPSMDAVKSKMREFWHDVGTSQCIAMKSQSIPLVSEIESAFEFVVSNVGQQSGMELTSCIKTFGSAALEASHPCISDLNLIAIVQSTRQEHDAKLSDTSQTKFLKLLCNKFVRIHEGAKIRIRISSNNGIACKFCIRKLHKQH
jgi:endonuclease/exonuclease/phosphatase family metal-dependent hydrolase